MTDKLSKQRADLANDIPRKSASSGSDRNWRRTTSMGARSTSNAGKRARPRWAVTPEQVTAWENHQADLADERRARQSARATAESACTEDERHFWVANRNALLKLGRAMPPQSGRRAFTNAGCVAAILSVVASGQHARDEVLHRVKERSRYSYQHIGFLLGQLTGSDPERSLWFKDKGGHYRMHGRLAALRAKLMPAR